MISNHAYFSLLPSLFAADYFALLNYTLTIMAVYLCVHTRVSRVTEAAI